MMKSTKATIVVHHHDNTNFFKMKLPTWRWGCCEIVREVTFEACPHGIYAEGELGFITVYGKKVPVYRVEGDDHFEIL
jgi:hypothetical protein